MFKRICAWCKKDLGSSITFVEIADAPITHGMCGDCARETLSFMAKPLRSFLDQFSKPVFLVDREGRIVTGNSSGLSFLQKTNEEVDGELGGDAFGCKYAHLPGGCGDTVHCKTCTIRTTVINTLKSGKSNIRIPAYPDLHHMTGEKRIGFLITTERIGEAVLLRIDEVVDKSQPQQDTSADADNPQRCSPADVGQGMKTMNIPTHIKQFWNSFEADIGYDVSSRFYEAFHFDDNETNANALVDLVLQGRKRATAGLLWSNEMNDKPLPKVGDLSVVTNWQQEPLCIIETTHVEIVPYEEVSDAFAAVEGEGDGSLRYWREVHWSCFSRECERLGKKPSLRMPIICERFNTTAQYFCRHASRKCVW